MNPLCIYHHNCADGFGAAWAVRHAFGDGNVDFHPGVHQNPPPDVTGRDVIIVDFSYKRPVLEAMAEQARTILILDHHKSAMEDLEPFRSHAIWPDTYREAQDLCVIAGETGGLCLPIVALFDMERSGARLAWDFFHPNEPAPRLIQHIEDRDLWRFQLEHTREIQAAVFSYPYDFAVWDEMMQRDPLELAEEGRSIERKHHKDIREFIQAAAYRATIAGYDVPVLNAPYFFSSEAGHIMGQGEPFAACYWDTPDGRVFSLRSADDGLDVSQIAAQFGGGGHEHAAGFRISTDQDLDRLTQPPA